MTNVTILIGRLTKDVDLRYTSNGTATGNFTLAVDRSFKSASGEKEVDFINCVVWRKPAETLSNFTKKGSKLSVVGRLQARSYENNEGKRVYVTEVVVSEFTFLDSKKSEQEISKPSNNTQANRDPFDRPSGQPIDISDDDLPF